MPIYEYKCRQCGEKFETVQGIFEIRKTVRCPNCGGTDTEKQFSPFFGKTDGKSGGSCDTSSFFT